MNQEVNTTRSSPLLEELQRLADLGEIAGPLAHEVNNFLNVLALNVAVLEQLLPEELPPRVAANSAAGRGGRGTGAAVSAKPAAVPAGEPADSLA